MASSDVQRKLTAILCADVAGYSRLMGADEEATVETLTAYRKVFLSHIETHHGRVVDAKGDAILAEFASVVNAVSSAVEVQRELAERNAELSDDRRMDFRIGINLGDVVVKDDVIYGDGVNVAARLESLSEPGGICVSRPVYDQVKQKLKLHFEYMGEQQVKNIAEPVRAYQVLTKPGDAAYRVPPKLQGAKSVSPSVRPRNWRQAAIPVAIFLVLGVGVILWYFNKSPSVPPLALPSIIVREGDNQTGDPNRDKSIGGIIDHIVTKLVQLQNLKVISRILPGEIPPPQDIDYLLELALQKEGDKMPLSVKLTDIETNTYKWAKIYDDILKNRFDAQDDIIQRILKEIPIVITEENKRCLNRTTTRNRKAQDAYDGAIASYNKYTKKDNAKARKQAKNAIEYDPNFANAYALLAIVNAYDVRWGPLDQREYYREAKQMADKALSLDDCNVLAYIALAYAYLGIRRHDTAIENAKKATIYGPNDAEAHAYLAYILNYVGRTGEAITEMEKAKDHSYPNPPDWYQYNLGWSNFLQGKYRDAIRLVEVPFEQTTNKKGTTYTWVLFLMTVVYNAIDNEEKANDYREKLLKIEPEFCKFIKKTVELYTDIEPVNRIRELALRPNLECK